jgi:hypothetical protein
MFALLICLHLAVIHLSVAYLRLYSMADWMVNEELEEDVKGIGHSIMKGLYR